MMWFSVRWNMPNLMPVGVLIASCVWQHFF